MNPKPSKRRTFRDPAEQDGLPAFALPADKTTASDGLPCPVCGSTARHVVKDSRPTHAFGGTMRRRRYCPACKSRFSTYELTPDHFLGLFKLVHPHELAKQLRELKQNAGKVSAFVDRLLPVLEAHDEAV